jgi:hypothetical protein
MRGAPQEDNGSFGLITGLSGRPELVSNRITDLPGDQGSVGQTQVA